MRREGLVLVAALRLAVPATNNGDSGNLGFIINEYSTMSPDHDIFTPPERA